jgi:hypothetical protein
MPNDHGSSPELDQRYLILFCSRLSHCDAVLGGVKAEPCGWPAASLDPTCGRHRFEQRREQGGEWEWGLGGGLAWTVSVQFPCFIGKTLAIEHKF